MQSTAEQTSKVVKTQKKHHTAKKAAVQAAAPEFAGRRLWVRAEDQNTPQVIRRLWTNPADSSTTGAERQLWQSEAAAAPQIARTLWQGNQR